MFSFLPFFFFSGSSPDSVAREHTEEAHVDADGSSNQSREYAEEFPAFEGEGYHHGDGQLRQEDTQ